MGELNAFPITTVETGDDLSQADKDWFAQQIFNDSTVQATVQHKTDTLANLLAGTGADGEIAVATDVNTLVHYNAAYDRPKATKFKVPLRVLNTDNVGLPPATRTGITFNAPNIPFAVEDTDTAFVTDDTFADNLLTGGVLIAHVTLVGQSSMADVTFEVECDVGSDGTPNWQAFESRTLSTTGSTGFSHTTTHAFRLPISQNFNYSTRRIRFFATSTSGFIVTKMLIELECGHL